MGLPWCFDDQMKRQIHSKVDKNGYNSYNSEGEQGIQEFKVQVSTVYTRGGKRFLEVRNKKWLGGQEKECLQKVDIPVFLACEMKLADEKFGDNDVEKRKYVTDKCCKLYGKWHNDGDVTGLTGVLPKLFLGLVKCPFFRKEMRNGRYDQIAERGNWTDLWKVIKPVFFKLIGEDGLLVERGPAREIVTKEFSFMDGYYESAREFEKRESKRKNREWKKKLKKEGSARTGRRRDGSYIKKYGDDDYYGEDEDEDEEDDGDDDEDDEDDEDNKTFVEDECDDFKNLPPEFKDFESKYYSRDVLKRCLPLTRASLEESSAYLLSDGVVSYVYYGSKLDDWTRHKYREKILGRSVRFKEVTQKKSAVDSTVEHVWGDTSSALATQFFDRLVEDRCGFSGGSFTKEDYEKSMQVGLMGARGGGGGGGGGIQKWSNFEQFRPASEGSQTFHARGGGEGGGGGGGGGGRGGGGGGGPPPPPSFNMQQQQQQQQQHLGPPRQHLGPPQPPPLPPPPPPQYNSGPPQNHPPHYQY